MSIALKRRENRFIQMQKRISTKICGGINWYFPVINAQKITVTNNMFNFLPSAKQSVLYDMLFEAVKNCTADFRAQRLMPSVYCSFPNSNFISFDFLRGKSTEVDEIFNETWWSENVKSFIPEKNTRIACLDELLLIIASFISDNSWQIFFDGNFEDSDLISHTKRSILLSNENENYSSCKVSEDQIIFSDDTRGSFPLIVMDV